MFIKLEHSEKQLILMDETEVGISILLKLLHRKKLSYLLSGIGGNWES